MKSIKRGRCGYHILMLEGKMQPKNHGLLHSQKSRSKSQRAKVYRNIVGETDKITTHCRGRHF